MLRRILSSILALLTVTAFANPLTAENYLQKLSPGINLGNTLEAIPTQTSWGNPKPTQAWFHAVRAAGFRSVRIPAAWTQYAPEKHQVGPKWMANVTDVVRMALRENLYVVLNIHWDGGWMQPTTAARPLAEAKLASFWKQIATNFRDFDDRVLFAGTNEVHVDDNYDAPTPENATVQNSFNQIFVNTVRATGGKNKARWLVVQGYNTDIDHALKVNLALPKDSAKGRLMMELHYYSPYNFALNEKSDIWQWGAAATDPKATETWANEAYVDTQFQRVKSAFIDRGVPVLLGEYGAYLKPKFPDMRRYQLDWVRYVTHSAHRHGLVPMYWDTGALFDRSTGARRDPGVIREIIGAAR